MFWNKLSKNTSNNKMKYAKFNKSIRTHLVSWSLSLIPQFSNSFLLLEFVEGSPVINSSIVYHNLTISFLPSICPLSSIWKQGYETHTFPMPGSMPTSLFIGPIRANARACLRKTLKSNFASILFFCSSSYNHIKLHLYKENITKRPAQVHETEGFQNKSIHCILKY